MPYCSILECKNDSRKKNLNNGGVSYHRFPKDPNIKEKWIDATGRANWMPTKSSTICSEHFLEDEFLISSKGYRYPKSSVYPTIKFVKFFNQQQNCNDATAGSSKRLGDSETQPKKKSRLYECSVDTPKTITSFSVQPHSAGSVIQLEKENIENTYNTSVSTSSTPRKKELKGQLRFCENKIKKQGIKIKRLQLRNRRLKNKINNIVDILKKLEDKFAITKPSKENLDCLKNANLEVQKLVARQV